MRINYSPKIIGMPTMITLKASTLSTDKKSILKLPKKPSNK
eukprot:UN00936